MILCVEFPTSFYYSLIGVSDQISYQQEETNEFWIDVLIQNIYKTNRNFMIVGFGFDHFDKIVCFKLFGPINLNQVDIVKFVNELNLKLEAEMFPSKILSSKLVNVLDIEYYNLKPNTYSYLKLNNKNEKFYDQYNKIIFSFQWNHEKWKSFLKGKIEFSIYNQGIFDDYKKFKWLKTKIENWLTQTNFKIKSFELQTNLEPNMFSIICEINKGQKSFPLKLFEEFWNDFLNQVKVYGTEEQYLYAYCASLDIFVYLKSDSGGNSADKLQWNASEEIWLVTVEDNSNCTLWVNDIVFWMKKRMEFSFESYLLNNEFDQITNLDTTTCAELLAGIKPKSNNLYSVAGILPIIYFSNDSKNDPKLNESKIFVLLQKRNPNMISIDYRDQDYWNVISGHREEKDETLLDTVYREMKEELGNFNLFGCAIQKIITIVFPENSKYQTLDFPLFVIQFDYLNQNFMNYFNDLNKTKGSDIEIDTNYEPKLYSNFNFPKPPKGYDWFSLDQIKPDQNHKWGPKEDPLRTLRTVKLVASFL